MAFADNKAIKIPEQHYVGFDKRSDSPVPLGFMTPDGTDKAAVKRKQTVDTWASGGYYRKDAPSIPAKSMVNKPMSGFKLGRNISGGGSGWDARHDKWRIQDPRGFELEINSGNLEEIMRISTIEKGEILEQCIWARLGQENILVPTESEAYKTASANTKRINSSASMKDLVPGADIVFKNGDEGTYMGRMFAYGFLNRRKVDDPNGYETTRPTVGENQIVNEKSLHTYLIKDKEGKYRHIVMRASLALSSVDVSTEKTPDEINNMVNGFINKGMSVDAPGSFDYWSVMMLDTSKDAFANVSVETDLVEIGDFDDVVDHMKHSKREYDFTYRVDYIGKHKTVWGGIHVNTYDMKAPKPGGFNLIETDQFENEHKIIYVISETKNSSWYGARIIRSNVTLPDGVDMTIATYYKLYYRYRTSLGLEMEYDVSSYGQG